MKLIIVLSAFVVLATCSPIADVNDWETRQAKPELLSEEAEENLDEALRAQASNIKYNYFRKGSSRGTVLLSTNVAALRNTRHDASLDSVYIIHGWTNDNRSSINSNIRDALMQNHDVNIFVVDWSRYSRLDYLSAQARVQAVGRFVGDFIQQTVRLHNVNLDRVRLVGFSLGAHVAGSAGKTLNGRVASIVGIDPAGPGFYQSAPRNRLDTSDAKYVQAIHTNAGTLGCTFAVGHSDFWPNGGRSQSGCVADVSGLCSHNKAFKFYAESVGRNRFVSRKCDSYTRYNSGMCRSNEAKLMGGLVPDTSAKGNYYLDTNRSSPFGQN